jgi:mRNA interferase MazF
MKTYQRGEVWQVDLGYAAKVRPCLILSLVADDDDRALVTLVPHTTQVTGSRFEITVSTTFLKAGVFNAQSLVTIPRAKLIRKLGTLTPGEIDSVGAVVRKWLGLDLCKPD